MKTILLTISTLFSVFSYSQQNISVTLESSKDPNCLSVLVASGEEADISLKVQSYKFYFDDEKLDLQGIKVSDDIGKENFTAQIAMNRGNLTREINGRIAFEKNMGFVAANVFPSNSSSESVNISFMQTIEVAQVCFDKYVTEKDVVLASFDTTSEYAKLFTSVYYEFTDSEGIGMTYSMEEEEE